MDGASAMLSQRHVDETARLLARVMDDDPAWSYLFPISWQRPHGLTDFFTQHLGTHVPHGCSHVWRGDEGAVQATVTMRPPGGIEVPRLQMLRGLLPFTLKYGRRAVRRLIYLRDTYEALERRAAGGGGYFHVHMMGVRPELQGRGIGGALLGDVLDRASGGAPIVLTTHRLRNVSFYRRAGFEVASHETLRPPEAAPYEVWTMRRG